VVDAPNLLPLSEPGIAERERADARRNRQRILCAAARIVQARGLDGFSMDDVAAEACVGKGTLYRRFGDRASLIRALVEEPERDFQDAVIRGEPPLGPGAPPLQRLHAFGAGVLGLLDQNVEFMRDTKGERTNQFTHPVYVFHRTHVAILLREILGEGTRTDYLVDSLLAPLSPDAFVYQRDVRGMSLQEMIDGWTALATAVATPADAASAGG
jgi:AcrR family transcriptional regulator